MFHDDDSSVDRVCYSLYRLDEATGETVFLGKTDCQPELVGGTELLWRASDPMHWPSIDGELICMELIQIQSDMKLYDVPVRVNGKTYLLRCGRHVTYPTNGEEKVNDYEIYGVWVGYDAESTLMNRSVKLLSTVAGQEFQLLYPIDGSDTDGKTSYESSRPLMIYRVLDVKEIPLPAGTYYLEYEIDDIYMRKTVLDRIEIHSDGEKMTIPHADTWADDEWIDYSRLDAE